MRRAQEIWLQNRLSGAAPLIVETNGVIITSYGQNDLSDVRLKTNIADADLHKLQSIFDAAPKRCRVDVDQRHRLGFLAQDFEGTGITGTTYMGGEEKLLTLDYSRPPCCGACASSFRQERRQRRSAGPASNVGSCTKSPRESSRVMWPGRSWRRSRGAWASQPRRAPTRTHRCRARPRHRGPGGEGCEFATLEAALPQGAVHPQKRNAAALKKDLAGKVHAAPEDVETQPSTEFRVFQDNAAKFRADSGDSSAATNGAAKQLASTDSMVARATDGSKTLLKARAPGAQKQRGARAGRAVRQLRDFNNAPMRPVRLGMSLGARLICSSKF